MRLPNSAHMDQPWRIHDLTRDFVLEDVWALPTPGGADDFGRLVQLAVTLDPTDSSSSAVRTLFRIRLKLGAMLGLDRPGDGLGRRVSTLRDRLPADLRAGPTGPYFDSLPFNPLYMTDTEFAAEIANRTVHGVVHLGWVADGNGCYRGQMAIYVKRNGWLGAAYMAAIDPFRHTLIYPRAMREIALIWRAASRASTPAVAR